MPNFTRWYDKDEDVGNLLKLLSCVDIRQRKVIANELLQIMFNELNIDNINQKVMELNSLKPEQNKRWYDTDIEVQSSIELIKNLTPQQRHELISRVIETLEQLTMDKGE